MRITQLSGIFLATVMLCGSIPLGFSEPLRVQLEQGMEINEIQCDNDSNVLVQRTNGKLACVSEGIAERMNWEIIENSVTSPIEPKMEPSKETPQESENIVTVPIEPTMDPSKVTPQESENIIPQEEIKPGITTPANILDVIPQDITFDYVVNPTDNPDAFAQRMIDFFDDELVEIKRGDYGSSYYTKKGSIKISDAPNITTFGEGSSAVSKYTFFGPDRIHPREAETVTYALLDELGITLDGTEIFKECVVCDNYDYYFEQTWNGFSIESNVIVTDFEPGYTFIYIGTWNDDFPDVEFYDIDKAREIAKEYALTVPELIGPECEIEFRDSENNNSAVSFAMIDGRAVYSFPVGTCQVEEWIHHHWRYNGMVDALTGDPLYVRGWSLF